MSNSEIKENRRLKAAWKRKQFTFSYSEFIEWYNGIDKKCHYCKITEIEIEKLILENKIYTKRFKTRGRKLEFERLQPDEPYNNLTNVRLCCYWCNNAKTDTFTVGEFELIGKEIQNVWQKRLNKS